MGLFDQVLSTVGGLAAQQGGGAAGGLPEVVLHWLNDPQTGGLSGLVKTFEQQGMAHVVASWISNGQNLPIDASQLQAVLGSDTVQRLAGQLGLNPAELSGQLAQWLPQIVDRLTPQGQLPAQGAQGESPLVAEGLSLLKGLLG
ncbi:YidB family protein [Curvibacter gracilis]|uniref:YidB family protein n=1 Tax=Curvibacter gracilis TaxID=230310 RepID=UPI00047FABDC|nr:YidB family protein [Curvibacter gracilis]